MNPQLRSRTKAEEPVQRILDSDNLQTEKNQRSQGKANKRLSFVIYFPQPNQLRIPPFALDASFSILRSASSILLSTEVLVCCAPWSRRCTPSAIRCLPVFVACEHRRITKVGGFKTYPPQPWCLERYRQRARPLRRTSWRLTHVRWRL
jgi:hypothetical protein